jgi:hypothetical protein
MELEYPMSNKEPQSEEGLLGNWTFLVGYSAVQINSVTLPTAVGIEWQVNGGKNERMEASDEENNPCPDSLPVFSLPGKGPASR